MQAVKKMTKAEIVDAVANTDWATWEAHRVVYSRLKSGTAQLLREAKLPRDKQLSPFLLHRNGEFITMKRDDLLSFIHLCVHIGGVVDHVTASYLAMAFGELPPEDPHARPTEPFIPWLPRA